MYFLNVKEPHHVLMDFEVGCHLTGPQILGGQAPQISEWQMDEVHLDLERF